MNPNDPCRPYGTYKPSLYGNLIPLQSGRVRIAWLSMHEQEIIQVIEMADRHFDADTLKAARAALRRRELAYERHGRRWA